MVLFCGVLFFFSKTMIDHRIAMRVITCKFSLKKRETDRQREGEDVNEPAEVLRNSRKRKLVSSVHVCVCVCVCEG